MNAVARVLLLDPDAAVAQAFEAAFPAGSGVRVTATPDPEAAARMVKREPPELLVAGEAALDAARDFLAGLAGRPGSPLLLVRSEAGAAAARTPGGAELLDWPLEPARLRARIGTALRLVRALREVEQERETNRRLREERLGRIVQALADLCALGRPGAAGRGEQLAALSARLAARFEVPENLLRDLELAARLHEIGHLVARPERKGSSPVGTEAWDTTRAAREYLSHIEGLEGAADLLGAVCENWDGSGLPEHLLQGQIPLRSRILRVGMDYLAALESGPGGPAEALAAMMEQRGGRYDPLVLVHLEAFVTGQDLTARQAECRILPIDSLEVGMVLADDLYTASGMKLLSRGARLGPGALESLMRRHRAEPIHHGATVRRTGT